MNAAGPVSSRRRRDRSTREHILEAARESFAEHGYDRATIRNIAARAGVDPALVIHYFNAKETLFAEAIELPVRPSQAYQHAIAAGADRLGASLVRSFLEAWEPLENSIRFKAMLRSALTNSTAMDTMRELLIREIFKPVTEALGVSDGQLRATLVGSQFVGLAVMRYIGCFEPLASASIDDLVAAIGPTIQRYLTEDLDGVGPG